MTLEAVGLDAADADRLSELKASSVAAAQDATPTEPSASPTSLSGSPAPVALEAPEPLSPEQTQKIVRAIFNPLARRSKVAPLDEDELRSAGECLTPALNRYVPYLFARHAELVLAGMWIGGVLIVRIGAGDEPKEKEKAA